MSTVAVVIFFAFVAAVGVLGAALCQTASDADDRLAELDDDSELDL